ncbi:putative phage abortive infection protein [uncultured Deefgea sp.]|uniref:putative phage abortive infection protein n=1 Tax=uncultured Deefgea sp. TaxID=1304914 RepID=UPI00262E4232|nr:putative phage abortive infection protein [uncultured Deefgea sp.]
MNNIFTNLKNKITTLNSISELNKLLKESKKIQNKRNNDNDKSLWIILVFASILVTAVLSIIFIKFQLGQNIPILQITNSGQLQYWGQLGDFFGGILNPLLSFTALMAILYSIKIQRAELKLARDEVATTNKIQRNQAKTFERQLFDTTFFGLLEAHRNILNEIFYNGQKGRDAFKTLSNDLYQNILSRTEPTDVGLIECFESFHTKHEAILGHYFRNLYHILKIIDSYDTASDDGEVVRQISENEKVNQFAKAYSRRRQYSNLLRAQLSSHEVALLFSNCLTKDGDGLKSYVELYSMLKTYKNTFYYCKKNELYNPNAFLDFEEIDRVRLHELSVHIRIERIKKMSSRLKKRNKSSAE